MPNLLEGQVRVPIRVGTPTPSGDIIMFEDGELITFEDGENIIFE